MRVKSMAMSKCNVGHAHSMVPRMVITVEAFENSRVRRHNLITSVFPDAFPIRGFIACLIYRRAHTPPNRRHMYVLELPPRPF